MLSSKQLRNMALVRKQAMKLEQHGGNPYHSRHIDQFCEYAELCARAVAVEQSKWKVEVDENSLKRVQHKINSMLDSIFGRR